MKPINIKKRLQTTIEDYPNTIKTFVAIEALAYCEIKAFFSDLQQHGCISGMISPLIYYTDTHKFYDKHYDEIEELREQYEDNIGESIKIKGDLKNFLAWFAFEETAYQLAIELGAV